MGAGQWSCRARPGRRKHWSRTPARQRSRRRTDRGSGSAGRMRTRRRCCMGFVSSRPRPVAGRCSCRWSSRKSLPEDSPPTRGRRRGTCHRCMPAASYSHCSGCRCHQRRSSSANCNRQEAMLKPSSSQIGATTLLTCQTSSLVFATPKPCRGQGLTAGRCGSPKRGCRGVFLSQVCGELQQAPCRGTWPRDSAKIGQASVVLPARNCTWCAIGLSAFALRVQMIGSAIVLRTKHHSHAHAGRAGGQFGLADLGSGAGSQEFVAQRA